MKQRATVRRQPDLHGKYTSGGVLWVLLTLVLFALVFLPVIVG